jgi:signal transduction histidine kinase
MTGSLKRLADAAGAVGEGNLEGTTGIESDDEVGRVAKAFDSMTRSLRRTLKELSERSALAAVGEFAATLAHEVRNPLTSVKLDLQEVEESLLVGSAQRVLQASAIEEIGRLDRTVGGALDIARSGRIEKTMVDLVEIVRMAARSARSAFEEGDAVLETPSEDTPPLQLMADRDALVGALLNLLRNAAQTLPPGGHAAIEVERLEGEALVRVRDEGTGIAPEILDRIFTPFFTTGSGGTGLGLAVARRVVVAHGGEIEVESELSRGTLVTIRLPVDNGTARSAHR